MKGPVHLGSVVGKMSARLEQCTYKCSDKGRNQYIGLDIIDFSQFSKLLP